MYWIKPASYDFNLRLNGWASRINWHQVYKPQIFWFKKCWAEIIKPVKLCYLEIVRVLFTILNSPNHLLMTNDELNLLRPIVLLILITKFTKIYIYYVPLHIFATLPYLQYFYYLIINTVNVFGSKWLIINTDIYLISITLLVNINVQTSRHTGC